MRETARATAQQAREMYDKAEAARVTHMVLFTYRWMPFFQYAHDLIAQGRIGRLYHGEFHYLMGYARTRNIVDKLTRAGQWRPREFRVAYD